MNRIYAYLGVRKPEVGLFWLFLAFNFLLMGGAFLARAMRDALFYAHAGPKGLPYAFLINAAILYLFSAWMPGVMKRRDLKSLLWATFGCSTIAAATLGAFFHWNGARGIHPAVLFLLFCAVETVIFLGLQLFGALVDARFTPKQSERLFPKFVGGGHLGITMGGALAVLTATRIGAGALLIVWAGTLLGCLILVLLIYRVGPRNARPQLATTPPVKVETVVPERRVSGFRTLLGSRYSTLFALITVCTFFVGALFDYSLADTATTTLGNDANKLGQWLGYISIVFGVVAFVIQFTAISPLIRRLGVEKVNLFAPALLTLGGAGLSFYSFHAAVLARFFYLVNEFVFNQTLIQFIYGAEKETVRSKIRFTIEGAVTFLTIGLAGLFLVLPGFFPYFKVSWVANLAFVVAATMLVLSIFLIPEYKKKVARRTAGVSEGVDLLERLGQALRGEADDVGDFMRRCLLSADMRVVLSALDTLRQARMTREFSELIRSLAQDEVRPQVRIAALGILAADEDSEAYEELRPRLSWTLPGSDGTTPKFTDAKTLRAWGELHLACGKNAELIENFSSVLKTSDFEARQAVMSLFVKSRRLDALTQVAETLKDMFASELSDERRTAAEVLRLIESGGYLENLIKMAGTDRPLEERRAALSTLGKTAYGSTSVDQTLELVKQNLTDPALRRTAVEATQQIFHRYPARALTYLDDYLRNPSQDENSLGTDSLLSILVEVQNEKIDQFILSSLTSAIPSTRDAALASLDRRIETGVTAVEVLTPSEHTLHPDVTAYQKSLYDRLYALHSALDAFVPGIDAFRLLRNELNQVLEKERDNLHVLVKLIAYSDEDHGRVRDSLIRTRRRNRKIKDEAMASLEQSLPIRSVYEQFQNYQDAVDFENADRGLATRKAALERGHYLGDTPGKIISTIELLSDPWLTRVARFEAGNLPSEDSERMEALRRLLSVQLLDGVPGTALWDMIGMFPAKEWQKGDRLSLRNEPYREAFLIVEGELYETRENSEPTLRSAPLALGLVEILATSGEAPLWSASHTVASDRVRGFVIDVGSFRTVLADDWRAARVIASNLGDHVARLNQEIESAYTDALAAMTGLSDSIQKILDRLDDKKDNETKGVHKEIEFKHLVDVDIETLRSLKGVEVIEQEQFYLASDKDGEVRLRRENDHFVLTIKGDGTLTRDEIEVSIDGRLFEECKPLARGRIIRKTRYKYPFRGYDWEIDIYDENGEFSGLKVVEVEVPSSLRNIPPHPECLTLLEDVTKEKAYKNKMMALMGRPKPPEPSATNFAFARPRRS